METGVFWKIRGRSSAFIPFQLSVWAVSIKIRPGNEKFIIEILYSLAHSCILDPDDKTYISKDVFTAEELHEIRSYDRKWLATPSDRFLEFLLTFNVVTILITQNALHDI